MEHTHIVKTCPYCQFPLKADSDVVVCVECLIPHHYECWAENDGCTTFGYTGLTGKQGNQPGNMQTTTVTGIGQLAVDRLDVTLDESPIPQMAEFTRPPRSSATVNGIIKIPIWGWGIYIDTNTATATDQLVSDQDIYQLTYRTGDLSLQDLPIGV